MSFSKHTGSEDLARCLANLVDGPRDELSAVHENPESITNGQPNGSTDGPPVIWLEPDCCADPSVGRTWCQDEFAFECEEGGKAVKYVRADLVEAKPTTESLAPEERAMLRRTLGLDGNYRYRNFLQGGPGHEDQPILESLVDKGLMRYHGDYWYSATEAGMRAARKDRND